jgi:hypothetical protein
VPLSCPIGDTVDGLKFCALNPTVTMSCWQMGQGCWSPGPRHRELLWWEPASLSTSHLSCLDCLAVWSSFYPNFLPLFCPSFSPLLGLTSFLASFNISICLSQAFLPSSSYLQSHWTIEKIKWNKKSELRPVETIPGLGEGMLKEKDGGVNSTMIYCNNFCKCHNVLPIQQ